MMLLVKALQSACFDSHVAKFFPNDKMFGFVIEARLDAVNKVFFFRTTHTRITAIMGGAESSDKIMLIESCFLDRWIS